MAPFALDIIFAMLLAALAWPAMRWLEHKVAAGRPLAALLTVLGTLAAVVLPLAAVATLLSVRTAGGIRAAVAAWPRVIERMSVDDILAWGRSLPVLGPAAALIEPQIERALRDALEMGSRGAARLAAQVLSGLTAGLLHGALTFFLFYFILKEGEALMARVRRLLPLTRREADELFADVRNTAGATLASTLVVGVIEGTLGGLLFLLFGLPSPLLFAMVMTVMSILPLLGTNGILVPAGIFEIAVGRPVAGVAIIAAGLAGVTFTQNFLKPRLVGDRTGLNPALALLSILGGIAWLGVTGFVIGPLVASVFTVIWNQFGRRYRAALDAGEADAEVEPSPPRRRRGGATGRRRAARRRSPQR
jgi:predicted PurR-regulated permease PerM